MVEEVSRTQRKETSRERGNTLSDRPKRLLSTSTVCRDAYQDSVSIDILDDPIDMAY